MSPNGPNEISKLAQHDDFPQPSAMIFLHSAILCRISREQPMETHGVSRWPGQARSSDTVGSSNERSLSLRLSRCEFCHFFGDVYDTKFH